MSSENIQLNPHLRAAAVAAAGNPSRARARRSANRLSSTFREIGRDNQVRTSRKGSFRSGIPRRGIGAENRPRPGLHPAYLTDRNHPFLPLPVLLPRMCAHVLSSSSTARLGLDTGSDAREDACTRIGRARRSSWACPAGKARRKREDKRTGMELWERRGGKRAAAARGTRHVHLRETGSGYGRNGRVGGRRVEAGKNGKRMTRG